MEAGQRGEQPAVYFDDGRRERERRERIQCVVSSDQRELAYGGKERTAAREPWHTLALDQPPFVLALRDAGAECLHDPLRNRHCQ